MKKRIFSIILVVVMALSLVACSEEGKALKDIKLSKYVKVPDYTTITVNPSLVHLEEYEYDDATKEWFRNMCEPIAIKEGAVQDGDWINLDYAGFKDGVQFTGGTAQDQFLGIGTNSFIPGFESGLIGVNVGETVNLDLTFPENYSNAELAGADVVFEVTVNYIVPPMTDEAVASLNKEEYSNIAEMKVFVKAKLDAAAEESNKSTIINTALSEIYSQCVYKDIPNHFIEREKEYMNAQFGPLAADYGLDLNGYFMAAYQRTPEEMAVTYVKQRFMIMELANKMGITVTEEEIDAKLEEQATYGQTTQEELLANYSNDRDFFAESIYAEKVYEGLYENVKVGTEEEASEQ